jgi:hypothetical protein
MALPGKPLELNINVDEMELDELELFESGGFSIKRFKAFMAAHSNWTAAEAGKLTLAELKIVAEKIGALVKENAVPK